jgi:hypothetical protein
VRPAARKHWGEIGLMLEGLGVIAKPHTLALAMLCEALADWIADHDAKAWERVLKACREFGMTPSAMSAVRSVKGDEKPKGLQQFKLA